MCDNVHVGENTTLCFTNHHPRPCSVKWTIRELSTFGPHETVKSIEFFHPQQQDRKFVFKCGTTGLDLQEKTGSLAFSVCTPSSVFADIMYSVLDRNGVVKMSLLFPEFCGPYGHTFPNVWKCIEVKDLVELDLVADDNLYLCCQVATYTRETISNSICKIEDFTEIRRKTLADDLGRLLANENLADVTVKVNYKSFKCCKSILSCRSALLDTRLKEISDNGCVELYNIGIDSFEKVLRYLYAADFQSFSVETLEKLLEASGALRLPCLKSECLACLNSKISAQTVWRIKRIAEKHDGRKLYEACSDFLADNSSCLFPCIVYQNSVNADLIKTVKKVHLRVPVVSCETTVSCKASSLLWTVSGFSKSGLRPNEYLESDKFFYSARRDLETSHLRLYPKGAGFGANDFVSVHLNTIAKQTENFKNYVYKLGIVDKHGKFTNLKHGVLSEYCRLTNFISNEQLFKARSYLLANDKLMLYCEIRASPVKQSIRTVASDKEIERMKLLSESLGKLLESRSFSDVTLRVSGSEFAAHRNILSARSPVFDAMFRSNMLERHSGVVEIVDVDGEVFEVLLRYMYTAELPALTPRLARGVLAAADKYQVRCLKQECAEYLRCVLSVGNAADIALVADLHDELSLKKAAMDVICDRMAFVDDWEEKFKSRPRLMTELLKKVIKKSNTRAT